MKLLILIGCIPFITFGQTRSVEATIRNGSIALGSWSVINMATSAALVKNSEGNTLHFHQMNGYWNIVNGSLAAYSLISPYISKPNAMSQEEMAHRYRRIFLINAGLDVVYITSGGFLHYFSGTKHAARNEGFGSSFLLQGSFLLAYDLWMAHRLKNWTTKEQSRLQIVPTTYGLALTYRFN